MSLFLSPNSKSRKSKPGDSVHPINEYDEQSLTIAPNQEPALTMLWNLSPFSNHFQALSSLPFYFQEHRG